MDLAAGACVAQAQRQESFITATRIERSGHCPQCTVIAENIEDQVVNWLQELLENKFIGEEHIATNEQSDKIQSRYNRVKELYISGQIEKDCILLRRRAMRIQFNPCKKTIILLS